MLHSVNKCSYDLKIRLRAQAPLNSLWLDRLTYCNFIFCFCMFVQISQMGSDDTYLLPDLLQKASSSSPTHNALGQQQRVHELHYSQLPTAPRSSTHQELHVSILAVMYGQTDTIAYTHRYYTSQSKLKSLKRLKKKVLMQVHRCIKAVA